MIEWGWFASTRDFFSTLGVEDLQSYFSRVDVECVNPTPIVFPAMERCVAAGGRLWL
jgi:hypothetical protein